MGKLTLGSLFSGSGGFEFGGLLCGIEPLWASEIEIFPIRVTTKRLPQVQHLGDINTINGAEIPPVDIIAGGFPCQNLSLAGKRAGLHGERSGLFFQMTRIIREMREATDNQYPRYVVIENVTGMYSSNKGQDFREVLNELIQIKQDQTLSVPMPPKDKWLGAGEIVGDGYSIAYRTLCASGWGVPQRRRRCYLVFDIDGERAGKILFESEGMSGYSPKGGSPWQGTAGNIAPCIGSASGSKPITFEPGALSRLGGHNWVDEACTLRADMGDNQLSVAIPINMQVATRHNALGEATGFGVGENGDPAYTLQSAHSHAVAVENHPSDSRVKLDESGQIQTLTGRMGTGGGNVPLVLNERQYALTVGEDMANTLTGTDYKGTQCVFEPKTLKIRSGKEGGGKGALVQDNMSATLGCNNDQTLFEPVQAYGISSYDSNSMKSRNKHSGIYEAETSRTLDGTGGSPACNQGGIAVVCLEGNGTRPSHRGSGIGMDVSFTLNTVEKHMVCYKDTPSTDVPAAEKEATYAMTTGCYTQVCKEQSPCLQARDFKDPPVVQVAVENYQHSGYREVDTAGTLKASGGDYPGGENIVIENSYVVRRLTPKECALLQGFPPNWCDNLETSEPTEAEISWWAEVFETHRKIMGTSSKSRSRNQIIKWLKNPHTDSAEYRLWGNGVCLNNVCFVMAGIVWADGLS